MIPIKRLRELCEGASPDDGVTNRHMQVHVPLEDLIAALNRITQLERLLDEACDLASKIDRLDGYADEIAAIRELGKGDEK